MRKSLEEFSKENRPLFDTKKIDTRIWTHIARELNQGSKNKTLLSPFYFKWAAAAGILLLISGSIYFSNNHHTNEVTGEHLILEQFPEYHHKIQSFTKEIDDKKAGLKTIELKQPGIYNRFVRDVTRLRQGYDVMEKELSTSPNKNILLSEMIENLEFQNRLLNHQLELIKELKESFNKSNGKNIKNI